MVELSIAQLSPWCGSPAFEDRCDYCEEGDEAEDDQRHLPSAVDGVGCHVSRRREGGKAFGRNFQLIQPVKSYDSACHSLADKVVEQAQLLTNRHLV